MKMARQYQQQSGRGRRFKVLSHYRSYHGSHRPRPRGVGRCRRGGPRTSRSRRVRPCPRPVRARRAGSAGRSDDGRASDAALALIEETIELEDPETIAAFITEPIMLSAGVRVPPPGYLRGLHDLLRAPRDPADLRRDHHGLRPHRPPLRRPSGSMSRRTSSASERASAAATRRSRASSSSPTLRRAFWGRDGEGLEFRDGHTYGNNPVAAAVGLAALRQLREEDLVANAQRQGERLMGRLRAAGLGAVAEVRGLGLLVGVALRTPDRAGRCPRCPGARADRPPGHGFRGARSAADRDRRRDRRDRRHRRSRASPRPQPDRGRRLTAGRRRPTRQMT